MPNSKIDTEVYISSINYSVDNLFRAVRAQEEELNKIKWKLKETEKKIQIEHDEFIYHGQFSAEANREYITYIKRIQQLTSQADSLGNDDSKQMQLAITRIGATDEAMSVIAGAILQIAKQVLSFRFGNKSKLPSSRLVKSLTVTELIWEGRNHSMHWEEQKPSKPIIDMFDKINADFSLNISTNINQAYTILQIVGWKSTSDVASELKQIIQ